VFLFVNGCVFSFAHLFLNNALVFTLTFVGSLLFALTFKKSQSLMLVSIEHSVYGAWLFTLGLGEMLAFPSV
jgi:membrane protease YdiL (CAAX protease family)